MSRHDPGQPGQPGQPAAAGPSGGNSSAERLAALVARQPLVLVVGPSGAGRTAALTVLAGPAAGGTMIDLGALWMAVDPPGDRPRTVRLNGAPSTVGRRGWEAIAGAIGAVAVPPSVVLVDTFQGLADALGAPGAAETITALVLPGRTVVVVLDRLVEAEQFQELATAHGAVVTVDGSRVRDIQLAAELLGEAPVAAPAVPPQAVSTEDEDDVATERRWRWWRREDPPDASTVPTQPARAAGEPAIAVEVSVAGATGQPVEHALTPGGYYLIRLAMTGNGTNQGVLAGPGLGAWVEVAVIAETVAVPPGPHAMFVPRRGAAWACPCQPGGPHTCLIDERSPTLDLPFVAPRRPDVYRVHVSVRHRGAVIHQTRLELPVAVDELGPAPTTTVTFQTP